MKLSEISERKPLVNFGQRPTVTVNLFTQTVTIGIQNPSSGLMHFMSIEEAVRKDFLSVQPASWMGASHALTIKSGRVTVVVQDAEKAAEENPTMTDAEYRQWKRKHQAEVEAQADPYGLQTLKR